MATYPLEDLRTRINDVIYPNEQHLITAETVNNLLQDIVDSLEAVIGEGSTPPMTSDSQKIYHLSAVSGPFSQEITGFESRFYVDRLVITRISGTPGTIRVGFSEFTSEVLPETDISELSINTPVAITTGSIPKVGQSTLYINLMDSGAILDIDIILTRYKAES